MHLSLQQHYSKLVISKFNLQVVTYYNVPQEERETLMVETPNPMCETFPRIAACNYIRFGSGGNEDKKNAICILGLNMINDKVTELLCCVIITEQFAQIREDVKERTVTYC